MLQEVCLQAELPLQLHVLEKWPLLRVKSGLLLFSYQPSSTIQVITRVDDTFCKKHCMMPFRWGESKLGAMMTVVPYKHLSQFQPSTAANDTLLRKLKQETRKYNITWGQVRVFVKTSL